MTACARCGDCCRVINIHGEIPPLDGDAWHLRGYDPGELLIRYNWTVDQIRISYDHDFMRTHWHEIPREMALSTSPQMIEREGPFYTCDMFDAFTNLCTAQDDKPSVCWGYPWYDNGPPVRTNNQPQPMRWLESTRCSYWADVPWQVWPRDVLPLPSPVENCC